MRIKKSKFMYGLILMALGTNSMSAQDEITGCNGKIYTIGDTLRIGNPNLSGYLFLQHVNAEGEKTLVRNENKTGETVVIKKIMPYNASLYEDMGIYEPSEKPQIVYTESEKGKYYIYLNEALSAGDIMSEYQPSSHVEGYIPLSPAILLVYALKLYNTPIDQEVVDRYMSLSDHQLYVEAQNNPFKKEKMQHEYQLKLEKAVKEADLNQVFRLRCTSEMGPYNMEKSTFPLDAFYCVDVRTQQNPHLSKLNYCLWGDYAFHFVNAPDFYEVPCPKEKAESHYELSQFKNPSGYRSTMTTSYVYVRIQNQPVSLPKTEIYFRKNSDSDLRSWAPMDQAYGKKALNLKIVQVDTYTDLSSSRSDGEVLYNHIGSQFCLEK